MSRSSDNGARRALIAELARKRIQEQTGVNEQMVRELVLASGAEGIAIDDLCRRSALSENTARKYLMRLRAAGIVERVGDGGRAGEQCRWGLPGTQAAHKSAIDKERKARKRYAVRVAEQAEAETWADRLVLRVIVKANEVPPMGKPGLASVWDLAA